MKILILDPDAAWQNRIASAFPLPENEVILCRDLNSAMHKNASEKPDVVIVAGYVHFPTYLSKGDGHTWAEYLQRTGHKVICCSHQQRADNVKWVQKNGPNLNKRLNDAVISIVP